MKQIRYNSAVPLRMEFPVEWDPKLLTGLTLTVKGRDGVELLAADAATLYTATTLAAAAPRFSGDIILDAGATDLVQLDPILITGVAGDERHTVKGFDSTTKAVELERILDNPHDSGDAVYGLFADYELNTTTVTDFPAGKKITLIWTPAGTGVPITETAQIAKSELDIEGFERDFRDLYERAHRGLTEPRNKFAPMLAQAERRVENELRADGLDIQRVVDQSLLTPLIMAKLAWMWALGGDEGKEDERQVYGAEYQNEKNRVLSWPIWADDDQDNVEDEGEIKTHTPTFYRGW
jgi:hypothetical protein